MNVELQETIVSLKRQAQALLREGRIELARKALDKAKEYEQMAKGANDAIRKSN